VLFLSIAHSVECTADVFNHPMSLRTRLQELTQVWTIDQF